MKILKIISHLRTFQAELLFISEYFKPGEDVYGEEEELVEDGVYTALLEEVTDLDTRHEKLK